MGEIKAVGDVDNFYENGQLIDSNVQFNSLIMYPNALMVSDLSDNNYTKHYYAGSQRIAARLLGHNPTSIIPDEDLRNTKHLDATALQKDLLHLLKDENIKITFEAEKSDKTTDIETNEDDRAPQPTEELYYYHPDHLGTATFLTDNNGNPYQFFLNLPFGESMAEQRSSSGNFNNRWKFNGKELDEETGLYYYGARFYNPSTSLWLSVDPLVEQTMDAYGYCYNNPINLIDPTGMIAEDPGDYFTQEGKYLGNDGIDDKKVHIVNEGDYKPIEGKSGTYSISKSTELKWFSGKNVNIDDFKFMSSVLYAESSGGFEETLGIYNVLENRAMQDGSSVLDQFTDKSPYGVYGVRDTERLADESGTYLGDKKRANVYSALISGITTKTDITNGAFFWDGKDFNGANKSHGGYDARYKPGYTFTSPSHDLWGQGNNSTSNTQQYESTNALGSTTFSRLINNSGKRWSGGTLIK